MVFRDVGHQDIPHAPVCFLSAAQSAGKPLLLLLEELHRGNFKLRSLGFLGGRQQIADVLRA